MSVAPDWLAGADRSAPWPQLSVLVAGIGVSGFAAADALLQLGAAVTVVDGKDGPGERDKATLLEILGARVRLGADAPDSVPAGVQLVVTSPGWAPATGLLTSAAAAGIPIWGEVELAWRLRAGPRPAPWLLVTGTNGKTTTVRMLASMLTAAGLRTTAAGNVGTPLLEVVAAEPGYDVLAVELSSFQLHWSSTVQAHSAAVLNVAPDHLDWHGTLTGYSAAKGKVYQGNQVACVYNVADPVTEELVRAADVQPGCRAIGFTLGIPAVGMVGVVDDYLVDRAFVAERVNSAAELARLSDLQPAAPHNVANALAAAALARAYGVPAAAVRDGLRAFRPDPHRIALVATVGEVGYVDDSKATNPHAAAASIQAYDRVVWIAGGLAKGADFDQLAEAVRDRLRGVVLIGADRAVIADALARHAPDVPVVTVDRTDTEVMDEIVAQASRLAQPGDTVLLAPACASMDMFVNYGDRGERFAAAVARLRAARGG
ncbi:MAG: UDP-N-acetylmuramoyl-L-alanine--D-glutamate ligase [Sporichthyaceae bacterium]|nr:UDP-N-acetylmuramoyl-L-alanine--D-glutamate ligase [Sporichthyaceae bacterium]